MRYDGRTIGPMRDRSEEEFDAFVADGGIVVIGRGRATERAEELEKLLDPFGLKAVIHYAKGDDECVVKAERPRESRDASDASIADSCTSDVLERCMATMGAFSVEVEPLLDNSALIHVPAWQRIDRLADVIVAANAIGRVRPYHESLTSIASRAIDGGRLTLVVEPDQTQD